MNQGLMVVEKLDIWENIKSVISKVIETNKIFKKLQKLT